MNYGTLRDYTLQDDVWVMALVLGCFLLLVLLIGHKRGYLSKMSRKFLLPTNSEEKAGQKTFGEKALPFFVSLTLIVSTGLLLFGYVYEVYDIEQSRFYIWSVLLLCLGALGGYYVLRALLYWFVNWVFFERRDRRLWMAGYSLMTIYESVIFYIVVCVGLFVRLPLEQMGLIVAICYGLLRLGVIPYTKRIFFPNYYGLLHLFAYLCTLEIIPLLFLYAYCVYWGSHLM